ncbi:NB-ARC domain-containing protein [Actinophytocola sediminis]
MIRGTEVELLEQLCRDLNLMWRQASGPSLRVLGGRLQLSKSQVGAILNGAIRRPPAWATVRGLVESFREYADAHGSSANLSVPTGVSEFWQPRHTVLEYAFSQARRFRSSRIPVPRQLPPTVPRLSCRTAELRALDGLAAGRRRAAATIVIHGAAGAGKTALAVGWAHRVRDRFPDGQLFADLLGSAGTRPADPAETIRELLLAFEVPGRSVPTGLAALSACYRSVLAERRVLVVLDDAHDTEQVLPLLPGAPGSLVVVTSRHRPSGLVAAVDAHSLLLGPLGPADARMLLAARLGQQAVSAEPRAVADIVRRSAGLPGPLVAAAAAAATNPGMSLAALAADPAWDNGACQRSGRKGEPIK